MTHSDLARYDALYAELRQTLPVRRLVRDPLRTLAYGTDASFYRLVPQLVVIVETEAEVVELLRCCRRHGTPVTFRAAGTSLSGQAVSDSVLAVLGDGWRGAWVEQDGAAIRLQPGVVGADANRVLMPFGRKIGPDPASIAAAKIGGIAANNASGMCCGTAQNSYQTVLSLRVVLADGAVLDTASAASRAAFARSHGALLAGLEELAAATRANPVLAERIRHKFKIKNTTGYSLNALVDFADGVEILSHLMIGSEGTLGFIAEITYHTVPDHALKASALLLFPDIAAACHAVTLLNSAPVSAVELMDRAALRAVEAKPGMPDWITGLPADATALLIETRAEDQGHLAAHIAAVTATLAATKPLRPLAFTDRAEEYGQLWNIRKGLFPAVGAMRRAGTTVIIEDVAFPIAHLAAATADLHAILHAHGYDEAIIFGHALDGNLHFVFTQDFGSEAEVARYHHLMDAVCHMVVDTYDGSLKAEHGTGRNMAPFVEMEWGREAFALMRAIKALFDPETLLNPGVILNDDPEAHLKDLKPLPAADPIVDKCIECGFCEPVCPSHGLTLSPRQRIVGWREIARLRRDGCAPAQLSALSTLYDYHGIDTCAACGLCATACPVSIETGRLTKMLRGRRRGPLSRLTGRLLARHYGAAMAATRAGLAATAAAHRLCGGDAVEAVARLARRLSGERVPKVSRNLPTAVSFTPAASAVDGERVVYLPSCAARAMGPAVGDPERRPLPQVVETVLRRAGIAVVYPENLGNLCCGQPFDSKGLADTATAKAAELESALARAADGGALTILFDTTPCALRMRQHLDGRLAVMDIAEFLHDRVLPRLTVTRLPETVALHTTCSTRRLGLDGKLAALARACAATVVAPSAVGCCGFAGDKGFTTPELNDHALRDLRAAVAGCDAGYSTSRTCEIGLADHADIPYRSIVYLLERASRGA